LGVFNRVGARSMSVTVEVVPNRPAPPKNVTATKNRTDGVLVSWHPVTGVDSYDVLRGQNASGKNLTTLGTTEHNVFLDTHASPGVTYYYYVESVGTKYNSVLSRSAAGEVKE
jgi:fibronectin type 3 domain-containing protein